MAKNSMIVSNCFYLDKQQLSLEKKNIFKLSSYRHNWPFGLILRS